MGIIAIRGVSVTAVGYKVTLVNWSQIGKTLTMMLKKFNHKI